MFYIQPFAQLYNNFVQNAPFSPSVSLFGVNLAIRSVRPASQSVPSVRARASQLGDHVPAAHHVSILRSALAHRTYHAFNLTIEHQFATDLVARVSYVGTQGRDLQSFNEIDPAIYGPGATVTNTNARRPLAPNYASHIQMTNGGISNYHSLQATLEKRVSRNFAFVANYTFSKSLDNQSVDNQFSLSNPNPFNKNFNYALSDFDTPHNFSLWGLWDLPRFASASRWLRAPLGGWETSGIVAWRSGTPFNVISGQDRSLSGVGLDRADLAGNPSLPGDRSRNDIINQYFNTAAFTLNALGTFGTSPRNVLRGPGTSIPTYRCKSHSRSGNNAGCRFAAISLTCLTTSTSTRPARMSAALQRSAKSPARATPESFS